MTDEEIDQAFYAFGVILVIVSNTKTTDGADKITSCVEHMRSFLVEGAKAIRELRKKSD